MDDAGCPGAPRLLVGCTLTSSEFIVVLVFSQIGQADVIAFTTSAVVVRDGRIVGGNTRRGMHRFAISFVIRTKSTPMVLSGVITVSVIKVGCPLRPVAIVVGTDNVNCVSD